MCSIFLYFTKCTFFQNFTYEIINDYYTTVNCTLFIDFIHFTRYMVIDVNLYIPIVVVIIYYHLMYENIFKKTI